MTRRGFTRLPLGTLAVGASVALSVAFLVWGARDLQPRPLSTPALRQIGIALAQYAE
jgi:hypothetical protein